MTEDAEPIVVVNMHDAYARGVADGAERAAQWLGAKFGAQWLQDNELSLKQHIFALVRGDESACLEGQAPARAFSPEEVARKLYFHHGIDENKPVLREDILMSLRQVRVDAIEEAAKVVEGAIEELHRLSKLYDDYKISGACEDQAETLKVVAHKVRCLAPNL